MRQRPIMSITLSSSILREVDVLADAECRSRSRMIEWLIRRALGRPQRDDEPAVPGEVTR